MKNEQAETEHEMADKQRVRKTGSKSLVVGCAMTAFFAVPLALMLVL